MEEECLLFPNQFLLPPILQSIPVRKQGVLHWILQSPEVLLLSSKGKSFQVKLCPSISLEQLFYPSNAETVT